jgi:hypothetical protein
VPISGDIIEVPMLSNKEKIGCLLKLFAWEFVTAAEKRDDAKRTQAALSSLLADAQWESKRAATCDKSRSLGAADTDCARLCMPSAALGGECVFRGLAARVALVMELGCACEMCRRVIPALGYEHY